MMTEFVAECILGLFAALGVILSFASLFFIGAKSRKTVRKPRKFRKINVNPQGSLSHNPLVALRWAEEGRIISICKSNLHETHWISFRKEDANAVDFENSALSISETVEMITSGLQEFHDRTGHKHYIPIHDNL